MAIKVTDVNGQKIDFDGFRRHFNWTDYVDQINKSGFDGVCLVTPPTSFLTNRRLEEVKGRISVKKDWAAFIAQNPAKKLQSLLNGDTDGDLVFDLDRDFD